MAKFYHLQAFEDVAQAAPFAANIVQTLADVSPPCSPGSVPRIGVWSLPAVGPKLQLSLSKLKDSVQADVTEHPGIACHVVILPNTPKWGSAAAGGTWAYKHATLQFQADVTQALQDVKEAMVLPCCGLYNEETMHSDKRELKVEFLLVLSCCTTGADGKEALRSIWSKSQLFVRKALPQRVDVFGRSFYKDWSSQCALFDRGHHSTPQELKQWHSGTSLLTAVLQSLCKGMHFSKEHRVLIKDMTLYDDQLGASVIALNANSSKNLPLFGYCGVAWGHQHKASTRSLQVEMSLKDQLVGRAKEDPASLPFFKMAKIAAPAVMLSSRPTYAEDQFKVTCPRANQELPVRQVSYDKFAGKLFLLTAAPVPGTTGLSWDHILEQHNREFNITGVPYKSRKREADVDVEALSAEEAAAAAVSLPSPGPDEPQDEAALEAGQALTCNSGHASHSFRVTRQGRLYIVAKEDVVLSCCEALFVIRGDAKQGPAALKAMKDAANWVPYKLSPKSLINVSFTAPVKGEWSEDPLPLQDFLAKLEEAGHVRVNVHLHAVVRDPENPGTYSVMQSEAETACLVVEIKENFAEVADLTCTKLANYLDVKSLKECPHVAVVDRFQFMPNVNKMMVGFPAVYPAKPIKLEKDKIYRLF